MEGGISFAEGQSPQVDIIAASLHPTAWTALDGDGGDRMRSTRVNGSGYPHVALCTRLAITDDHIRDLRLFRPNAFV